MRRMIPQKQIETLNHISLIERRHVLATDLPFETPQIHLTDPMVSGISSNYNVDILAAMNEGEGDYSVEIQLTDKGITLDPDYNMLGEGYLKILNLPTSDPGVQGALWNDNGTLKISAGE